MKSRRLKFKQKIGSLAVIQGTVRNTGEHLEFELAMTESISGPVGGVMSRVVRLSELEAVEVKRRFWGRSKLEFTARSVSALRSIPGSRGFKYSVLAEGAHSEVVSFVRELLFDIAQVEMDELTRRLDRSDSSGGRPRRGEEDSFN